MITNPCCDCLSTNVMMDSVININHLDGWISEQATYV